MRISTIAAALTLAVPLAAWAQGGGSPSGVTQSRDGLSTASQGKASSDSMPAGGVNAQTGPQSRPAYPSGSTTANPGAAFVKTMPVPSTGPAAAPPGIVSTTTVGGGGSAKVASPGVGQAATPAK